MNASILRIASYVTSIFSLSRGPAEASWELSVVNLSLNP